MLILIGIVINITLGENGLIRFAKDSKDKYINAQECELLDIEKLYSELLVAVNDNAKITLSMQDLNTLIEKKVQEKVETIIAEELQGKVTESLVPKVQNQVDASMEAVNTLIDNKIDTKMSEVTQDIEDELKPVELYSGNAIGNFTLNQSIDNFSTIEITYVGSDANGKSNTYMKTTPSELKTGVSLNTSSYCTDGNKKYIQLFSCKLVIDGVNATRNTTTYAYNAGLGTSLSVVSGTGNIWVTKVNGYY